jgi:flap endonuclease-1
MGLDLKLLVEPYPITISELSNKIVAVDAYNAIYQFLATIRGPTGELLTSTDGDVTSHLSGLFYRNINLLADNIKLIYVFDGKPNPLKLKEIERRRQIKQEASERYHEAITEGRVEDARKYSQATSILTDKMVEESKKILTLLGIPFVLSPSEGEAAAAYMTKQGTAFTCASQDYDSILFGARKLTRNLTISGKRKVPNKKAYIAVEPEIIEYERVLNQTKLTHEQLVDVGILIGTDFNPEGFAGIGPKTALKLIREYGKLENIEKIKHLLSDIQYQEIRDIYLKPEIPKVNNIQFNEVNYTNIVNFLCTEKSFSAERVNAAIEKLKRSISHRNQSLENWFS